MGSTEGGNDLAISREAYGFPGIDFLLQALGPCRHVFQRIASQQKLRRRIVIDDLVKEATARDFVADAFQHCKFIGYDQTALPLLEKAGLPMISTRVFWPCLEKKACQPWLRNSASCVSGAASRR